MVQHYPHKNAINGRVRIIRHNDSNLVAFFESPL